MNVARRLHLAYRAARTALLVAATPLDRAALALNGRDWYPPIHLRRQAGPLATFERSAAEFAGMLAAMGAFVTGTRLLDVGCGPGALAMSTSEHLGPHGRYTGFDVHRPSVTWAQRHRPDERFSFLHHDYWNASHNPGGRRFLPMPVDDGSADVVVAKSVFTHMLPDDVDFYLREVARVLASGGTAFLTAYCYQRGDGSGDEFPHEGGTFRYRRASSPESALALDVDWLLERIDDAGLHSELIPGYWRRPPPRQPVTYQDMLVVTRAGTAPDERLRSSAVARFEGRGSGTR